MTIRTCLRLWVAMLTFLICGTNAHAIDPENHEALTKQAVTAYRQCIKWLGVRDALSPGGDNIAQYTSLEDRDHLWRRLMNWHFYDAHDGTPQAMGWTFFGGEKSLHHLFRKHIKSLGAAIDEHRSGDVYEYSGRILHYIQDMTVPAHVAPNFHFKFIIDKSDPFDSMPEWKQSGTYTFIPSSDSCRVSPDSVADIPKGLNGILGNTADDTLTRIRKNIPVPATHRLYGKTWEYFWIIRDARAKYPATQSGFAPYGAPGRNSFRELCASDHQTCMSFFRRSYRKAIDASVKTLLLINAAYNAAMLK